MNFQLPQSHWTRKDAPEMIKYSYSGSMCHCQRPLYCSAFVFPAQGTSSYIILIRPIIYYESSPTKCSLATFKVLVLEILHPVSLNHVADFNAEANHAAPYLFSALCFCHSQYLYHHHFQTDPWEEEIN